jgi:hypothetical protein
VTADGPGRKPFTGPVVVTMPSVFATTLPLNEPRTANVVRSRW